ncbi:Hypothetical predicted protein [Scomber scombrus]|uniref:Uncharacterized protein n=1 Tax=Scomber scombrus TaxID=13677 RepID=A0AAV1PXE8_SCOSC
MGGPARALLGGFGTTTTSSSLEVGARMAWPSNISLDLNQSQTTGIAFGGSGGLGNAAAMSAGLDNFTQEPDVTSAAIKQKNWPALLILVIIALTIGGNILVILADFSKFLASDDGRHTDLVQFNPNSEDSQMRRGYYHDRRI